jgi:hypothetical protein
MTARRIALGLAFALLWPLCSEAQTRLYRWIDAQGKVHYTDKVPTEAAGRATDELNKQGAVVRKTEAALTAEQREQAERDRKSRIEVDVAMKEEKRKNMALLNTYASENDIEEARTRALKGNEDASRDAERKLAEARKRQTQFKAEAEFFVKKPMPAQLKQDLQVTELELRTQGQVLESKKKEVSVINAKYNEDRRRYVELTKSSIKAAAPTSASSTRN